MFAVCSSSLLLSSSQSLLWDFPVSWQEWSQPLSKIGFLIGAETENPLWKCKSSAGVIREAISVAFGPKATGNLTI